MLNLIKNGNIFESSCDVLVNPVNCVGVMGAGLAKQFAIKFPEYEHVYRRVCANRYLHLGEIDIYTGEEISCIAICSLPTKNHWKDKSKIVPITSSCKRLRSYLNEYGYSCAIPALGCGLGELEFAIVKDMLYTVFDGCESLIEIYAPLD